MQELLLLFVKEVACTEISTADIQTNTQSPSVMLMRRESTAVTLALDALCTSAILNMQASLIDTALCIAGVGDDDLVTASA